MPVTTPRYVSSPSENVMARPVRNEWLRYDSMNAFEPRFLYSAKKRLMTAAEIGWLDDYHERVRTALAPILSGAAHDWLLAATSPLLEDARAVA